MTSNLPEEALEHLKQFAAMKDEPLHEDLTPYLTNTVRGLPIIAHPLIHDIMPINGYANRKYVEKTKALDKAVAEEDWETVVFLHEKPYRLDALLDYVIGRDGHTNEPLPVKDMSKDVRDLTAFVWADSENIHQHVEEWGMVVGGWEPGDPPMFIDNQEAYDALPDLITVWRGDVDDGRWSWSTKKSIALFFARRWEANVPLLSGIVRKDCVFGFIANRRESEVMCHMEHVMCLREHEYEKREPKQ